MIIIPYWSVKYLLFLLGVMTVIVGISEGEVVYVLLGITMAVGGGYWIRRTWKKD